MATMEKVWEKGFFRLFLSHSTVDKDKAARLKEDLTNYHIDAFVAHADISPSEDWIRVIETALETCGALVALLSQDFRGSAWTDQEVGYCLSREVPIIPVRLGINPYGFMGRYQALAATNKNPAKGIAHVLARNEATGAAMVQPLVNAFARAHSFADAKTKMDMIEEIDIELFTKALVDQLGRALVENRQVREASYVHERVIKLVKATEFAPWASDEDADW